MTQTPFPPPPAPDEAPFEIVPGNRKRGFLLLCDHATNQIPARLGDLGLPAADRARHIAYDVGVRGVTLGVARTLNAPAVLSTFSRLVIDPNRGEDDPTLVMRLYDRSIIPGNADAGQSEIARRLDAFHRPYHAAIDAEMDAAKAETGAFPTLIMIHSYTPQLRGRPPRPWHVGILWDEDAETARFLLDAFAEDPDLCVGDNAPYKGALNGDTAWRHGAGRGAPHGLIEIRSDLITSGSGQAEWAEKITRTLLSLSRARSGQAEAGPKSTAPGQGARRSDGRIT